MLLPYFAALTFVCSVSAASPYFPYAGGYAVAGSPYTGAYAGAGGAYAGAGGVFAGSGLPFPSYFPWTYPVIPPIPIVPFPVIKPWYEGDNVCKETYLSTAKAEDTPSWASILFSNTNYHQSSQTCKGDENIYVCEEKIQTPEGIKIKYTKYACCLGFVYSSYDSSCVESPEGKEPSGDSTAVPPTAIPNKINDINRYESYQSSSSSFEQSGAKGVPAQ